MALKRYDLNIGKRMESIELPEEAEIYGESKNQLIKNFPTSKVVIIENSGHIPWKHNPTKFNELLLEFY